MLYRCHLFCTTIFLVLMTPSYSSFLSDFTSSNGNGKKESENKLSKFLSGDFENQDRLLDKKILVGKQQMKVSRDELVTSLLNGAMFIGSMTLYYFAFKRIGESLMGLMKTGLDQKGGGDNMHPSIKKFLAPNITLNSYELEVLNVKLAIFVY
mmetsp:Transcript_7096/g.7198  ORF Transcript_7096/g.7198 Transcript_7096/m.7198 type:complete len:153 (+) Transcript_7096:122-580(+)